MGDVSPPRRRRASGGRERAATNGPQSYRPKDKRIPTLREFQLMVETAEQACDNGLIERRADPDDRRAKRLFLTPAAHPLMDRLAVLGEEIMGDVLAGIGDADVTLMLEKLGRAKENLREAIQKSTEAKNEARYG